MTAIRSVSLGALAIALAACAQPAQVGGMVAHDPRAATAAGPAQPLRGAIALGEVSGGRRTSLFGTSQVGNDAFAEALRRSLHAHGLLAPRASAGRYRLDAALEELDQPSSGLALTVRARVTYRLLKRTAQRQAPLARFEETVTTQYTAELGESLVIGKRMRLANEGAIRENIDTFIERLLGAAHHVAAGRGHVKASTPAGRRAGVTPELASGRRTR